MCLIGTRIMTARLCPKRFETGSARDEGGPSKKRGTQIARRYREFRYGGTTQTAKVPAAGSRLRDYARNRAATLRDSHNHVIP